MAIPTTVRGTPAGVKMGDGFKSMIALVNKPTIAFFEKSVKPPGADGGAAIDTRTHHNTLYVTKALRALVEITDAQVRCAYDPKCIDDIYAQLNVNQGVTVHHANLSTLDFWGGLTKFEPNDETDGSFPEATCTFVCTNTNPTSGAEEGPNFKTASGTD